MINLTLRNSTKTSFFKQNLLNLCSQPGDILVLSYGYFSDNFSNFSLSTFLSKLVTNLDNSGTKKIYIIGGQLSISNFPTLSAEEKTASLNSEKQRISNILANFTNNLNKLSKKPSNLAIKYLYKARSHSKLAIKFNSNLTSNISILIGSSNLTAPSILDDNNLNYFNIESDIFLTDINPTEIIFNNNSNFNFHYFLHSIHPTIVDDIITFNFD